MNRLILLLVLTLLAAGCAAPLPPPAPATATNTPRIPDDVPTPDTCGDLACQPPWENPWTCPGDCPKPTSPPETPQFTLVFPELARLEPAQAAPGEKVRVTGSGGSLFTPPSGYDESARSFALKLEGAGLPQALDLGRLSCYANHCEALVTLPADLAPGDYQVAAEGGSKLPLRVVTATPAP
jgi:hypothetical protein